MHAHWEYFILIVKFKYNWNVHIANTQYIPTEYAWSYDRKNASQVWNERQFQKVIVTLGWFSLNRKPKPRINICSVVTRTNVQHCLNLDLESVRKQNATAEWRIYFVLHRYDESQFIQTVYIRRGSVIKRQTGCIHPILRSDRLFYSKYKRLVEPRILILPDHRRWIWVS